MDAMGNNLCYVRVNHLAHAHDSTLRRSVEAVDAGARFIVSPGLNPEAGNKLTKSGC